MLETDGDDVTSIAEIHLAGFDGRRLPRESWKVLYADSEDTASGNHAADKIFDLQESTYWSTEKGTPAPHRVVIDLGGVASTSALQLLPRMESGAPGLPSAIKVFVR